jgi:hypothetical protein
MSESRYGDGDARGDGGGERASAHRAGGVCCVRWWPWAADVCARGLLCRWRPWLASELASRRSLVVSLPPRAMPAEPLSSPRTLPGSTRAHPVNERPPPLPPPRPSPPTPSRPAPPLLLRPFSPFPALSLGLPVPSGR